MVENHFDHDQYCSHIKVQDSYEMLKKILLPIDGSAHSQRAAEYAVQLVRDAKDATLHVIHVEEPFSHRSHAYLSDEQIKKIQKQEAEEHSAAIRQMLDKEKIPYTWHLEIGEPARCVLDKATSIGAHAIVMGTRGHGSFGNLVLGSVATKVIHGAAVPVTVVK